MLIHTTDYPQVGDSTISFFAFISQPQSVIVLVVTNLTQLLSQVKVSRTTIYHVNTIPRCNQNFDHDAQNVNVVIINTFLYENQSKSNNIFNYNPVVSPSKIKQSKCKRIFNNTFIDITNRFKRNNILQFIVNEM